MDHVTQKVNENLNLVDVLAKCFKKKLPPHISLDDLKSDALLGLFQGAKKWDPNKKVSFRTFVRFRIKGAMLDGLRYRSKNVLDTITLIDHAYDNEDYHTYERIEEALGSKSKDPSFFLETKENFYKLINQLPGEYRQLMISYFENDKSIECISKEMKISISLAYQMKTRSLKHLKDVIEKAA